MKLKEGSGLPGYLLIHLNYKDKHRPIMVASVRTRFAPSPTGYLHVGGVRTALFAWLYARHHQGSFILRIEDTDTARSSQDFSQIILDGLQWLGLDYDEGPYFQSQRYERYQQIIQTLLDEGKAYYCRCSKQELDNIRKETMAGDNKPSYDRRCRDKAYTHSDVVQAVVRFKNPLQGKVIIADRIQGTVVYQNTELDDLIIAKSDGMPTYNLAVVVDDMDMQITHVIRGDDHLNNTPRQINIYHALGAEAPDYAHMPLIMGEDGSRLSKRHGAANILQYKTDGYLAEALLNYLVRLGWSHGDQEIFSMAQMIEYFDFKDVNKSAASINPDKLLWLNQHHIKTGDDSELADKLSTFFADLNIDTSAGPALSELVGVQKQRSKTMLEIAEQSRCFYLDFDTYDIAIAKKYLTADILLPLQDIRSRLASLDTWSDENLHQVVVDTSTKFAIKMGKIAQPLRVAITASTVSPSIDATLRLLGKQSVLKRLDLALQTIARHS